MNYKPEPQATIEDDDFYMPAVELVRRTKRVSISYIQRQFKIGYNRAARLVEAMESQDVVSNPDNKGHRDVFKASGIAEAPICSTLAKGSSLSIRALYLQNQFSFRSLKCIDS